MTLENIIKALQTVAPYYADTEKSQVWTETDRLFLSVPDKEMTREDVKKMLSLGCVQPECVCPVSPEDYDPEDYWMIFL